MHRSIHRWMCYFSRGSSLSRHISSSSAASLLSNCPLARPQSSHAPSNRDPARWQRSSERQAACSPIFSISVRQFASRNAKSPRGRSTRPRHLDTGDYNSIDDLLRDSCSVLNSGGSLRTAAVWSQISRLICAQQPSETVINLQREQQLEQQVDELFHNTMASLDRLKPKELTTIILSMAKITKTVKGAKQNRQMNSIQREFSELFVEEDSSLMKEIFDFCAMAADRILPLYDARHLSNLA
jgi:hypothetical protein